MPAMVYIKELDKKEPINIRHFANYISEQAKTPFINVILKRKYIDYRYLFWLVGTDVLHFTVTELAYRTKVTKSNIINQINRAALRYEDNTGFKQLVDDTIQELRKGINIKIDGEVYE